jgi:transposase
MIWRKPTSTASIAIRTWHIGEEVSERYDYIPAQMLVIEEACQKYACACTIRTASKPPQPIEKSTASASGLAQVIVAKIADHLPVHRPAKMFRRLGVELSDQTLCGWLRQSAGLLEPLYQRMKGFVLSSKVVGTDDTPVKVLDRRLPRARQGRFWPYVGDREHPAVVYDYTPTRERDGPEQFLRKYKGYLRVDAYPAYDRFFTDAARELVELGCWAHARRHAFQARDTDPARMGAVLAYIAQLYAVEKRARKCGIQGEDYFRQNALNFNPHSCPLRSPERLELHSLRCQRHNNVQNRLKRLIRRPCLPETTSQFKCESVSPDRC